MDSFILIRQYRDEEHTSRHSDSSLVLETGSRRTFTGFIYCTYHALNVHTNELGGGEGYSGFEEIYIKEGFKKNGSIYLHCELIM